MGWIVHNWTECTTPVGQVTDLPKLTGC